MSELLPCPFCGEKGENESKFSPDIHTLIYYIYCENVYCGISTSPMLSQQDAISIWNRRTTSQPEPVKIPFNWELIATSTDKSSETLRAKVIGGWVFNTMTDDENNRSESMVFIPDPQHLWSVE